MYPGWRDVRQWLSEGPHISAGLLWNDNLQREDNDKQDGWKKTKNLMARWAVPLEEAWGELWPRWARRGTESCGGDLCAGPVEHRLWFPRASGLGNITLGHSLSGKWTRFVFCTKCQLSSFSACSWVSAWSLLLLWCQTKPQPATGWKSQMIITLEGNSTTRSMQVSSGD